MKLQFLTIALLLICSSAISQTNYGKVWIQGTGINYSTTFSGGQPVNQIFDTFFCHTYMRSGQSNICDSAGNLILITDGFNIYGKDNEVIDNGNQLVPPQYYSQNTALKFPQASIFLPAGNDKYYCIINTPSDSVWNVFGWDDSYCEQLRYSLVDMNANGGQGKVTKKNRLVIDKTNIWGGHMMACRHGNGKDWWLLKQGHPDSNIIYKFLFTQDSVYGPYVQHFNFTKHESSTWYWTGQSMFSADGTRYALTWEGRRTLFLADFDRCTGTLSNEQFMEVPLLPIDSVPGMSDTFNLGLSFSPNGQFLYISHEWNIHQLDLADMNQATKWYKVAGMDTASVAGFQYYSNIYPGLDGKLYIGNDGTWDNAMSVINNPNAKGAACTFCPKCLRFPTWTYNNLTYRTVSSPPCMPNYKLGATNPPCTVGVAETEEQNEQFSLYPNPATSSITIEYNQQGVLEIADMQGRIELRVGLTGGIQKRVIDIGRLSAGVYLYTYETKTGVESGKLVVY